MVELSASSGAGSEGDPSSRQPESTPARGLFGRIYQMLRFGALAPRVIGRDAHSESVAEVLREHGGEDAPLREEERVMLLNLLRFRSWRVDDVMVPRADIIAVEADISLPALLGVFTAAGHSRLPVYRETLDDPIGMVHIKDVLACFGAEEEGPETAGTNDHILRVTGHAALTRIKRDVLFVPPSMPAAQLLVQMQAQRVHMALVIDEYGGTDGLVTIEDLVEMIVGDIEDEHDTDTDPECTPLESGGYLAEARLEIMDFHEISGLDLRPDNGEEDEVDTLGGLVFALAGRVPRRGEIIRHPSGYDLEIVEADPRRIRRLKVTPSIRRENAGGGAKTP
jgi:CBS domain containing-hemolysin-like protein